MLDNYSYALSLASTNTSDNRCTYMFQGASSFRLALGPQNLRAGAALLVRALGIEPQPFHNFRTLHIQIGQGDLYSLHPKYSLWWQIAPMH
jgi:hypothetical protein